MIEALLQQLVCPFCGGSFAVRHARTKPDGGIEYGILACGCCEFPVVAGIPILKATGRVDAMKQTADSPMVPGPEVSRLNELIRRGRGEEALLWLLVMPDRGTTRWMALTEALPPALQRVPRSLAWRSWESRRERYRELLLHDADRHSAMEMIRFFYHDSVPSEVCHYFACRFGQPRHLAALSLAQLLPHSQRPILDLACGFGHFMHTWNARLPVQFVIGIDRNFFQLYVAKRWVAPRGQFVCSAADVRLPFRSGACCGVFCCDAFHYFLHRLQSAEEMRRVIERGGPIVLARFGNREVEPREGYELSPMEYRRLFDGWSVRMRPETELLDDYLAMRGPRLADDEGIGRLAGQKWLSLVACEDQAMLRDHEGFQEWPHGAGRLRINPLYQTSQAPDGSTRLAFQFPSRWYEFENGDCLRYMPKDASISREALAQMGRGIRTPEVEELIRQCVVVGMPERYL
jgi:SAM-dependent methyltransferase